MPSPPLACEVVAPQSLVSRWMVTTEGPVVVRLISRVRDALLIVLPAGMLLMSNLIRARRALPLAVLPVKRLLPRAFALLLSW